MPRPRLAVAQAAAVMAVVAAVALVAAATCAAAADDSYDSYGQAAAISDSPLAYGYFSSLAISPKTGLPVIAFAGGPRRSLYFARCLTRDCRRHSVDLVWQDAYVNYRTAMAFVSDRVAVVAFNAQGAAYVAVCTDGTAADQGGAQSTAPSDDGDGGRGNELHCDTLRRIDAGSAADDSYAYIDPAAPVCGWGPSVAVNGDGHAVIAYIDQTIKGGQQSLVKLAVCRDALCRQMDIVFASPAADNRSYGGRGSTAVAIDAAGMPLVVYKRVDLNPQMFVTSCLNANCSLAVRAPTVGDDDAGLFAAVAMAAKSGDPLIAYDGGVQWGLAFMHCLQPDAGDAAHSEQFCAGDVPKLLMGGDHIEDVQMVQSRNGTPLIAFVWFPEQQSAEPAADHQLMLIACNDAICLDQYHPGGVATEAANLSRLAVESLAGRSVSIAVGADGRPVMSYLAEADPYPVLRFARCKNAACSGSSADAALDKVVIHLHVLDPDTDGSRGWGGFWLALFLVFAVGIGLAVGIALMNSWSNVCARLAAICPELTTAPPLHTAPAASYRGRRRD